MKHISPPRFSRLRALPLCAVFLGLLLVAGWSGCERVTSSLSPQSTLSPDELPKQGNTVLPKVGNVSPDVRVVPPGDARKSGSTLAGSAPELNLDRAELRAYIKSVADIHDERYISLFVKADSSGGFYHYAYESLNFHPIEEERSKGERELFVYVRPNKTNDGVFHLNLGLIPRTRSSFEDYQRWLLPFHANSTPRQKQGMKDGSSGSLNLQFDSTEQTCYFTSEFVNLGENWWDGFEVVDTEHCVAYTIDDTIDDDLNGGGGICWSCEYPGGGGSSNPSTGCDGDPNAVTDDCGRCVGGNTGRLPATDGMDCDKICEYDDPFLDRMDVQAEIHTMWNASFGPNSNPLPHDQRNEAVTFVNLFANNEWEFVTGTAQNVTSCFIEGLRIRRSNALFAILHTHPYVPDERVYDPRCYVRENERRTARGLAPLSPGDGIYRAGDVSGPDSSLVARFEVPMYVIDEEGVRKLDQNTFVPGVSASYAATYNHCWD